MAKQANAPAPEPAVDEGIDISEAEELAGIKAKDSGKEMPEVEEAKPDKPEAKGKEHDKEKQEADGRLKDLLEEREKRKTAEREHRQFKKEQEERNTRLDERLRLLTEARERQEASRQTLPDPQRDPVAFNRYLYEEQRKTREYIANQAKQGETERAAKAAEDQVWGTYQTSALEYAKENPDFADAYNYLLNSRASELMAMGYTPGEIQRIVRDDEFAIAQQAIGRGQNPAEIIFKWATDGRGFKPGNGAEKANGAEQVKKIGDAKLASQSLSKAGGSAGGSGKITLESLDRMTPDEFNDLYRRFTQKDPEGFDKLIRRLEVGGSA